MPKRPAAATPTAKPAPTPEEIRAADRFETLAEEFLGDPAIARASMFGMTVLKVGKRVFAALADGQLIVKLPPPRIEALVSTGVASRFQPFGGPKQMKEWIALPADGTADWVALANESRAFVEE